MNVLDLGFFRSIKALQYQKATYNVTQLLRVVNNAFDNLSPKCLGFVFIRAVSMKIKALYVQRKKGPLPSNMK